MAIFTNNLGINKGRRRLIFFLILLAAYGGVEVSFRLQGNWTRTASKEAANRKVESSGRMTISPRKKVVDLCDNTELCVSRNMTTGTCNLSPCQGRCQTNNNSHTYNRYGRGRQVHRDASVRGILPIITERPIPTARNGCLQSDKYRFLFLHVLKSGGSTVKEFLKRALCNSTKDFCTDSSILRPVDCRPAIQAHPDYRVWGFVRNPYGRYYSGYAMALSYKKVDYFFSFEDFVLKSNPQRAKLTRLHLSHFASQASFLLDRKGCPVMDFVGRLEHIEHDLGYFLNVLGSPELLDYFHTYGLQSNNSTNYASKRKAQSGNFSLRHEYANPEVQARVLEDVYKDFAYFGFDPDNIPPR